MAVVAPPYGTQTVNANAIHAMYARSLAWLMVVAAVIGGVSNVVSLVLIDFVHGNPHRTQENAFEMIIMFTPLLGLIAAVGTVIVFALPQCFQAVVSGTLVRRFGGYAQAAVLLVLPMTAVITWYPYDYLTPSDFNLGINDGPDWQPYQHGLTAARYLSALACQTPATLFSVAYVGTTRNPPASEGYRALGPRGSYPRGRVCGIPPCRSAISIPLIRSSRPPQLRRSLMQTRAFGKLPPVSALTLGGGGLGMLWGKTTFKECVATVHAAIGGGITLLDLAPRYGDGKAEEVVGAAFNGKLPAGVRVTSKCNLGNPPVADIEPTLRRSIEASLHRLRTKKLDLFFLHSNVVPDTAFIAAAAPGAKRV